MYLVYLFFTWSSFRYFFNLPIVIEELWFKPVIWLVPIFWICLSSRRKVNFFRGNILLSLFLGVMAGLVCGLLVWLVIGMVRPVFGWEKFGVGLVTSVTEGLVFFGFVLPVLIKEWSRKWGLTITAVLFSLIHFPVLLFDYQLDFSLVLAVLVLTLSMGLINGFLRMKMGNVIAPITASWIFMLLI